MLYRPLIRYVFIRVLLPCPIFCDVTRNLIVLVLTFVSKGSINAQVGMSGICGKGSGAPTFEVRINFDCVDPLV